MKKETILNVPAIQKNIHTQHSKFIKEYGNAVEKVIADHRLFADLVMTKIYRLALIFKEEKVIDDIKMTENGPYREICLSRSVNTTYVNITTNGLVIVLEGYTYTTGFDTDFQWPRQKFYSVNENDFDWEVFSAKLLDYIHNTIYEKKEAMEARLHGIFEQS
jgi:hypothetical protein